MKNETFEYWHLFAFESEKQTLKKLTKVIKNVGKNVLTTTKFGSFIAA
jgi:hypothetical protein